MRLRWRLCIVLLLWTICLYGVEARRFKRSIREFNSMIKMMTGMKGLDFNGYGNYCGMGGGGIPLDPIDECCMHHDHCYGGLSRFGCVVEPSVFKINPYTSRYQWVLANGNFQCLGADTCRRQSCICDSVAAECFATHVAFYDGRKRTTLGRMLSSLLG